MGKCNSNNQYIYYYGQESFRRNGVALRVNKRVQNAILGCNLKNNRMSSVCFQGKSLAGVPSSLLSALGTWRATLPGVFLYWSTISAGLQREKLQWGLHPLRMTQHHHLASLAPLLSSKGISYHDLLPHVPSGHFPTINSRPLPGVALQSLHSSSQPPKGSRGFASLSRVRKDLSVWFSFYSDCYIDQPLHFAAASNSSLLSQTLVPCGDLTPASVPPDGWDGKECPAVLETQVRSLSWEDPLEKGMATHSSIAAWKIMWTEEPGGLQSIELQRARSNWATDTFTFSSPIPGRRFSCSFSFFPSFLGPTQFCVDIYSFPVVRDPCPSQLVFCKIFCVWRCIPDVSMERDVLHVHLLPLPSWGVPSFIFISACHAFVHFVERKLFFLI